MKFLKYFMLSTIVIVLVVGAFFAGASMGYYQPQQAKNYAELFAKAYRGIFFNRQCGDNDRCGFNEVTARVEVDCGGLLKQDPATMVILAFGQSNSANSSNVRNGESQGVYNLNFFDGQCYVAKDPLLGATGEGGSVWLPMASRIISQGYAKQVIIVPFGVGGSEIARWVPQGDLSGRINRAVHSLKEEGLTVSHVVWHQGESDVENNAEQYTALFGEVLKILREQGIAAPVYPAIATRCNNQGSEEIRRAQRNLPRVYEGVFSGPDSDKLGREFRFDNCHFNQNGIAEHAKMWVSALFPATNL